MRLTTANTDTTKQAQYTLPFPVAAALVHKPLTVAAIDGAGLQDKMIQQRSKSITLYWFNANSAAFPDRRIREVSITLNNGHTVNSCPTEAGGDPEIPLDEQSIDDLFDQFATPRSGKTKTTQLRKYTRHMGNAADLNTFNFLIYQTK